MPKPVLPGERAVGPCRTPRADEEALLGHQRVTHRFDVLQATSRDPGYLRGREGLPGHTGDLKQLPLVGPHALELPHDQLLQRLRHAAL